MLHHQKYLSTSARRNKMPFLVKSRSEVVSFPPINLGWGIPNPDIFPFKAATFTTQNDEDLCLTKPLINESFQYAPSQGILRLYDQVREIVTRQHAPPHMEDREVLITAGANSSIYTILHTFLDDGDYVFVPEYTYATFLTSLLTTNAKVVSIQNDGQGVSPNALKEALKNSPADRRKLLYLIPNGDNPTGVTLTEDRRREIYSLACEYDILILEDDPYHCLQYGSKTQPSFLSLDTEGRVLRVDSFAKTVGGGLRLGYLTADTPFTNAIEIRQTTIMAHAPAISQVIASELLQNLGYEGFIQSNESITKFYKKRRNNLLATVSKYLTGLCTWTEPDGMFIWMKVIGVKDTFEITQNCLQDGVLVIPGKAFQVDNSQPCPYIRLSFTTATQEQMEKGLQILTNAIRAEMKTKLQKIKNSLATTDSNDQRIE